MSESFILPTDVQQQFDQIADAFEADLNSGQSPDISELLTGFPAAHHDALLQALLEMELEVRLTRRNEQVAAEAYYARFSGYKKAVDRAVATTRRSFPQHFAANSAQLGVHHKPLPAAPEDTSETQYQPTVGVAASDGDINATEPTVIPSTFNQGRADDGSQVRWLGDYELLEEIARGAMGVVYKARQLKLNRLVALKMILSGEFAASEEVQRFQTEAEAAARLDHPGIVPIFETGQHNGHHYFAMGFVDGGSLRDRVKDGPLPPREAADIARGIAEAVAYAHGKGVVHRDLKPANVLLSTNGEPKVTDFGLAKQLGDDDSLTKTGTVMGTPGYMPPEQAAGRINEVGPHSDVYSLGAVLYCLLTGRPPFQAASVVDTLQQVLDQAPVPPRALNPQVHRDLNTICLKCLEKYPPGRYRSAQHVVDELDRFAEGAPILARPIGRAARTWRWCRRHPALAGVWSALGLAAAAVVSVILLNNRLDTMRQRVELRDARLAIAEKDRLLKEREIQAAREIADTQRYYSVVNQVGESVATGEPGTRWQNLSRLTEAAGAPVSVKDPLKLRNLASRILGTLDIRQRAVLWEGTTAGELAFSPTDDLLAISESKDWLWNSIQVFTIPDGTVHFDLSFPSSKQWMASSFVQDGATCLSFSPDGHALAAGTRSGQVHVWDLSADPPKLRSWQAHSGKDCEVRGLAFSQHDARLFSSQKSRVKSWDLAADAPGMLQESKESVSHEGLSVSSDGHYLARASVVLDTETLRPAGSRVSASGPCSVFDRTGRVLIAASTSRLALCDLQNGNVSPPLVDPALGRTHANTLRNVALHPTGTLLATSGDDGFVKLWDLTGWFLLRSWFVGGPSAPKVSIGRNGQYIAATADKRTLVFELAGLDLLSASTPFVDPIDDLAAGRRNDRVVTLSREKDEQTGTIRTRLTDWTVSDTVDTQQTTFAIPQSGGTAVRPCVASSESGNTLAVSDANGGLHLAQRTPSGAYQINYDRFVTAAQSTIIEEVKLDYEADEDLCQVLSDDTAANDQAIRIAGENSKRVFQANIPGSRPGFVFIRTRVERLEREVKPGFAFESGIESTDSPIQTVDAGTDDEYRWQPIGRYVSDSRAIEFWIHATTRCAAVWLDQIAIVDAQVMQQSDCDAIALSLSPNGGRIWAFEEDSDVLLSRDMLTGATRKGWSNSAARVLFGANHLTTVAATDSCVAVGAEDGHTVVLNADDAEVTKRWNNHGGKVTTTAISPDESLVVSGTFQGRVTVHALPNGNRVDELFDHKAAVTSVDFGTDSASLVTAATDRTIRLYKRHGATFNCVLVLPSPTGVVQKLQLCDDGKLLVFQVRGENGFRVWRLSQLRLQLKKLGLDY